MGRPIILFQRVNVLAAPALGTPTQQVSTDPNDIAPPEDMQVDYIVLDEESGAFGDLLVRPQLGQREYWPNEPTFLTNYNNLNRGIGGDDQGEHWLEEPFKLSRRHSMSVRIQNRIPQLGIRGKVMFQGTGLETGQPYDLPINFELAAGTVDGVVGLLGGRFAAVTGRENIEIHAITWTRHPESEGWDPRLIGMQVEPSYGQKWSGPGSTAGGAGSFLPPLYLYSNIRGPLVGCFYRPPGGMLRVVGADGIEKQIQRGVTLLQSEVITFEFQNLDVNGARVAHLGIIGTAKSTISS